MPPQLALVLALAFVGYLLCGASGGEARVSSAVWIPVIWLMIAVTPRVTMARGWRQGFRGSTGV